MYELQDPPDFQPSLSERDRQADGEQYDEWDRRGSSKCDDEEEHQPTDSPEGSSPPGSDRSNQNRSHSERVRREYHPKINGACSLDILRDIR